jgi:hypothetical protein
MVIRPADHGVIAGQGGIKVCGAPGTLSLSAGSDEFTQINLSWSAPSDTGGGVVSGYHIQVSTNSGVSWSDQVADTGSTGTTYTASSLTDNTRYDFKVAAINEAGTGTYGNAPNLTTAAFVTVSSTVGSPTLNTYGNYKSYTFTSSGSITFGTAGDVSVLLVAGGGGSSWSGGGGGGGEVEENATVAVTASGYTITIGGGGGRAANGVDSSAFSLTAIKGGYGTSLLGGASGSGSSAGSGVAGSYGNNCDDWDSYGTTTSYGYGGGGGDSAGGGGGSGNRTVALRCTGTTRVTCTSNGYGGAGGAGTANTYKDGSSDYYGGGGGGLGRAYAYGYWSDSYLFYMAASGGGGGNGGGGAGGWIRDENEGYPASQTLTSGNAASGTANTGGGGGGGEHSAAYGSGGSGVVIVRWQYQ